jgi:hypothetical protein
VGCSTGPTQRFAVRGSDLPAELLVQASAAALASYLANGLAQITATVKPVRAVSPFHLLFGNNSLTNGIQVSNALLLAAVRLAVVALGGLAFAHRDLH